MLSSERKGKREKVSLLITAPPRYYIVPGACHGCFITLMGGWQMAGLGISVFTDILELWGK